MNSIGNNIKSIRKQVGLTQEELALHIGVTPQAVSRWENGTGMPDISLVVPLAKTLNVSTDYLFGLEENKIDDDIYVNLKRQIEKIEKESETKSEAALASCQFMLKKVYESPDNYIYSVVYVEQVANLSRFVDLENFAQDKWSEYRGLAIKYGSNAIRFTNAKEWVERAHFALALIYIHDRNYVYAREHIEQLPSVASNRLQESILAQLEDFENGIDAMDETVTKNLQNFVRAINKENMYAMESFSWNKPLRAVEFGEWAIRLMNVFGENIYLKSYCRGFLRDIYKYLINAEVNLNRFDDAAKHFEELKRQMKMQYKYHQGVLSNEEKKSKYNARQIGYMEAYTEEFMKEKQQDIIEYVLGCWHGEKAEKFAGAIGYSLR